ncbi:GNAT family N-acetyltransferase [Synechococcus sp. CS-1324]|uniref:GNAT family N-acetyltransferase n=1 Tax=Synechococcus sp. CS-1324 TaxID=2847980 RepID=UPI000DB5E82A|nr:GNAT family N-acetyltransferase [Synechococcus sp. CS-1324]MCT0229611.1 GNAT family N-acetyltransferase [Synechococcus sp. CS-1324]PZV03159.1 MAG: ribosomal-protein-alanine acetyltransferase [Cyanobium sp.]
MGTNSTGAAAARPGERDQSPRRLSIDDLTACCALDQLALDGLWTPIQWRQELDDPDRLCLGLGPATELAAMGIGAVVLDELHVSLVAVHPERRRRGLGRLLLQTLLREGGARGCRRATLEVSEANGAGIALYAALGFRTAGRRRSYYRNGDDALIQWAELKSQE